MLPEDSDRQASADAGSSSPTEPRATALGATEAAPSRPAASEPAPTGLVAG